MTLNKSDFRAEITRFYTEVGERRLPLGMGGAYIGAAGDADTQQRFQAVLENAFTSGIRYYDTSSKYGGSEFRYGHFLRQVPRCELFLATKSPIPPELTPTEAAFFIRQAIRCSQERLGVETIDLFQIHDVETLDQVLAPEGVIETLVEARNSGQIRYFGLATRYHDLLETAAAHGEFDTILTYADYTPADQSAASLIAFAAEHNIGVINASPLGFGLFTGLDPRTNPHLHSEFRRSRRVAGIVYDTAQEFGIPVLAVAMQYPMLNPGIQITLTGAAAPEELRATLDACQVEISSTFWHTLHERAGVLLPPTSTL